MTTVKSEIVVIGGGPGGYAAAFYAADRGYDVTLIEKEALGGVCLNRGCIPSKALLNVAHLVDEASHASEWGVTFSKPKIELKKLRKWKDSVVSKLSSGVASLAKARGVKVIEGRGFFEDSETLRVETEKGQTYITFKKAILATGSVPAVPAVFDLGNPRVMTSTEALNVEEIPSKLLVVGGGYIGMELGTVYARLGSDVVVAEALPNILTGADKDLARPVMNLAKKMFSDIRLSIKVKKMETAGKKIKVTFEDKDKGTFKEEYDRVLISVGRVPNCDNMGLENTKIKQDDKGFVKVNHVQETNDPNIMAIGDIAGGVLLAHKASKEARIAVDHLLGETPRSQDVIIPAVVFTDPELAWCGLTEEAAKEKGIKVKVAKFPWSASGRAMTFERTDGLTKLILEPETERVLGVGIVGRGAGELIAEGVLAVEMGATAADLAEVVHPHPTLSETVMESAEALHGYATHIFTPQRGKK